MSAGVLIGSYYESLNQRAYERDARNEAIDECAKMAWRMGHRKVAAAIRKLKEEDLW